MWLVQAWDDAAEEARGSGLNRRYNNSTKSGHTSHAVAIGVYTRAKYRSTAKYPLRTPALRPPREKKKRHRGATKWFESSAGWGGGVKICLLFFLVSIFCFHPSTCVRFSSNIGIWAHTTRCSQKMHVVLSGKHCRRRCRCCYCCYCWNYN